MPRGGKAKDNSEKANQREQEIEDHGFADILDDEEGPRSFQGRLDYEEEEDFSFKSSGEKIADLEPSILGLSAIKTSGFSMQIENGNKYFSYFPRFPPRGCVDPAPIFYRLQGISIHNLAPGMLMAVLIGTNWKDANMVLIYQCIQGSPPVAQLCTKVDQTASSSPQIPATITLAHPVRSIYVLNELGIKHVGDFRQCADLTILDAKAPSPEASSAITSSVMPFHAPSGVSQPRTIQVYQKTEAAQRNAVMAGPLRRVMDHSASDISALIGAERKIDHVHCLTTAAARVPVDMVCLPGFTQAQIKNLLMFTYSPQPPVKDESWHLSLMLPLKNGQYQEFVHINGIREALYSWTRAMKALFQRKVTKEEVPFFSAVSRPWIDIISLSGERSLKYMPVKYVEENLTRQMMNMANAVKSEEARDMTQDQFIDFVREESRLDMEDLASRWPFWISRHETTTRSNGAPAATGVKRKAAHALSTQTSASQAGKFSRAGAGGGQASGPLTSGALGKPRHCIQHLLHTLLGMLACKNGGNCVNLHKPVANPCVLKQEWLEAAKHIKSAGLKSNLENAINALP